MGRVGRLEASEETKVGPRQVGFPEELGRRAGLESSLGIHWALGKSPALC